MQPACLPHRNLRLRRMRLDTAPVDSERFDNLEEKEALIHLQTIICGHVSIQCKGRFI